MSAGDPTTAVEVWTAIGTCFGGLATAFAVSVALWIAHRDWRRADAERRDQEKAQARLVVSRLRPDAQYRVSLTNSSAAPVFQVVPQYSVTGRDDGLTGSVSPLVAMHLPRDVLTAGEEWTVPVSYTDTSGALVSTRDYYLNQQETVTIAFVDSAGLRWRRVNNDEPTRVLDAAQDDHPSQQELPSAG